MSRHPEVKWAQRLDKVYITVQLPDAKDVKVNLEPDGVLTFSATAGSGNNLYELKLDLHDKVNVEESKINTGVRSIFCVVEKAEKGWWMKLLRGDGKTPHYVKVDWDKWVDQDDGPEEVNLDGMDFSNFGGMEGMGGMGGMGGLGGMGDGLDDDIDDSDDEGEQEVKKPEDVGKSEEVDLEEVKTDAAPST